MMTDEALPEEFDDYKSKSQLKREMHALLALGQRLLELKPDILNQLPLNDRLRQALEEGKRIKSFNAQKRHLQFIGKLMRDQDTEAIIATLDRLDSTSEESARRFHLLERWRDRLIDESTSQESLNELMAQCPEVEVQHVRQLIRQAHKEAANNKPPSASRKLFRYLRELDLQQNFLG
ncbi:ribosome biogenesis factor YjgA [Zooshikella ganghwensis]|uniref:ribosome biogenesis factor YjgA n=1 Tax=Zooshikella ganghwensis TaxID=202772 RepID=UPI001F446F78|nr:ribosome biogenesis factor YjgA [Zooshikella ganghwensis]